jgi:hypothetical protein
VQLWASQPVGTHPPARGSFREFGPFGGGAGRVLTRSAERIPKSNSFASADMGQFEACLWREARSGPDGSRWHQMAGSGRIRHWPTSSLVEYYQPLTVDCDANRWIRDAIWCGAPNPASSRAPSRINEMRWPGPAPEALATISQSLHGASTKIRQSSWHPGRRFAPATWVASLHAALGFAAAPLVGLK